MHLNTDITEQVLERLPHTEDVRPRRSSGSKIISGFDPNSSGSLLDTDMRVRLAPLSAVQLPRVRWRNKEENPRI